MTVQIRKLNGRFRDVSDMLPLGSLVLIDAPGESLRTESRDNICARRSRLSNGDERNIGVVVIYQPDLLQPHLAYEHSSFWLKSNKKVRNQ